MTLPKLRPAMVADLAAVQTIYAHHVRHSTGTFEIDPPDVAEIHIRWTKVTGQGWPWLVSEAGDGNITGFAYAGPFRDRPAYHGTLEDSVYVAPDHAGRGLGSLLLGALMTQARVAGGKQMLAVIGDSGNLASVSLHRRHGFVPVGVFSNVGHKFGRNLDVVLMQASL